MSRLIYLDNAATTRVKDDVLQQMLPYFTQSYGNPSSVYGFAQEARAAVEKARTRAAELIGATPHEIYFTSGGSEADNWALKSVVKTYAAKGKHIITSKIEHSAILKTCEKLHNEGVEITYLDVDENGKISLEELSNAIREDTILISIMTANNEVGTLQPIKEIGRIAHEKGVLFHTDAVQAYGHIPIDVNEFNIDLLSASGHKLHGPKGVGILYVRTGTQIGSFIDGGAQERGRRAGTINTPGIVGMGAAALYAKENLIKAKEQQESLRDYFIKKVLSDIPYTKLNGHVSDRLPGNLNFTFSFASGESLIILLDQAGICASSGSACASGSTSPSHVLTAMGLSEKQAGSSVRFSLSDETTKEEIDITVEELKRIVTKLRGMSLEYKNFLNDGLQSK